MKVCKDCKQEKDFSEFYTNGDRIRPACKPCTRLRLLACRFKITVADILQMYKDQDGKCAICKKTCDSYENLSVDHDHKCCPQDAKSCGKCVRGLLCARCNHGIGNFKDDPELLRSALRYLGH